jgi:phage terminase large subunit-like protein
MAPETIDVGSLAALTVDELEQKARENPEWFAQVSAAFLGAINEDRQKVQLAHYNTVNPDARALHLSTAREVAVIGGNRSSKTDTSLAELAIRMTGHIPQSLMADYPREKLKLPIRARVVVNSLTDTLEPIIKPKLRWDQWNGADETHGHWGWIPKHCLIGGSWEKSYSDKNRMLSVCADTLWRSTTGERVSVSSISTCQFMSYDQDLSSFTGSSLHLVLHDELPPSDIYREHRIRTLDVKGQIISAFTPPDETGAQRADTAWFFDEVYEKGLPGPQHDPRFETITLMTERNSILSVAEISELAKTMTEEQREVRLHGRFLHLSGVIYNTFSARDRWWCYRCERDILPVDGTCAHCRGSDVDTYRHVIEPFAIPREWPLVFVIDPHPRKKDAMGWFVITPSDDIIMVSELSCQGTAAEIKKELDRVESLQHWSPCRRLMDPNIATESNDKLRRGWTLRQAYDEVGLRCDLAVDELNPGIERVQALLKPDKATRRPRFQVFDTCPQFIHGMQRWAWDEWSRQSDRDPKESPRDRFKDFPDLIRYLANGRLTYEGLRRGYQPLRPRR